MAGRGSGRHDHGGHQYNAHSLQANDNRNHQQGGEQYIQRTDREPQAGGEFRIEGDKLEFLPKDDQQPKNDEADDPHRNHVSLKEGGGLAKEELVQACLGGIGESLCEGEQHQAEPEEHRKDQTQSGIVLDVRGSGDGQHEECRQPACDQGTKHEHNRLAVACDQEGQHDAGQSSMRNGITEQALFAQDGEGTKHAADKPEDGGADRHCAQGVIEQ